MQYTCSICKQEKDITEFCINRAEARGRDYFCKSCKADKKRAYYHSIEGVIQTIFDSQKLSCKTRGHPMPEYSKQELTTWLLNQEKFKELYSAWVASGYNSRSKPSVDRIDDFKTYSLSNIQLVTFRENEAKGHSDRHLGKGTQGKYCKAVLQFNADGTFVKEYISASLASEEVPNTNRQNIQKVCNGERPLCGGFLWKYKS